MGNDAAPVPAARPERSTTSFHPAFRGDGDAVLDVERRLGGRADSRILLIVLTGDAKWGIPVALNICNKKLFNSLEERQIDDFVYLMGILALVIAANVLITTTYLPVQAPPPGAAAQVADLPGVPRMDGGRAAMLA